MDANKSLLFIMGILYVPILILFVGYFLNQQKKTGILLTRIKNLEEENQRLTDNVPSYEAVPFHDSVYSLGLPLAIRNILLRGKLNYEGDKFIGTTAIRRISDLVKLIVDDPDGWNDSFRNIGKNLQTKPKFIFIYTTKLL
jgi:hypothetical protein